MKTFYKFLLSSCLVGTLTLITAIAQDIKFGKYSQEEIDLSSCEYEPDAAAVVIYESASSYFVGGNLHTDIHFRKKVFNPSATDIADVTISYYHGGKSIEIISGLKAQIVNFTDGKEEVIKLSKKEIFEIDAGNGRKEYRITFPNVQPGSILEYSYKKIDKYITFLDGWSFQNRIPTMVSKYSIDIPEYLDYRFLGQGDNFVSRAKKTQKNGKYEWELTNLKSIKPEPYISNFEDYLDKIEFQLAGYKKDNSQGYGGTGPAYESVMSSWQETADELTSSDKFGGFLKNNASTKSLKEIPLEGTSSVERMASAQKYIQENFENSRRVGIFPSQTIKELLGSKSGTKADLNLLLLAMLRANNISAYPLLISSKGNGRSTLVQYPFITQFNQLIIVAEDEKGTAIYLDASDKELRPGYLSLDNHVEGGFVLMDNNSGLMPIQLGHRSGVFQMVNVKLNEQNEMTFDNVVRYSDYDAIQFRNNSKGSDDLEEVKKAMFSENQDNINLLEVNVKSGPRPQIDTKFTVTDKMDESTNLIYLTPFKYLKYKENPFKEDSRQFPVDFNYSFSDNYSSIINIPDGFELDDFPESINIAMPDGNSKLLYSVTQMEGMIKISAVFEMKNSMILASDYKDLKYFLEMVTSKFKEPVVLKRIAMNLSENVSQAKSE
ncbi:DUF3857 domain-containing protein [Pararhodonellum marinum]|uniref:DUF3857 domain-containing protein n=1 Tax=Pararhodonellum marinum TaxID=2755358 RepID=UPI00188E25BB|nr:DUF3857 domain-containing protein [Pararhodonellum marinum]